MLACNKSDRICSYPTLQYGETTPSTETEAAFESNRITGTVSYSDDFIRRQLTAIIAAIELDHGDYSATRLSDTYGD
jgi:hypothetical protein